LNGWLGYTGDEILSSYIGKEPGFNGMSAKGFLGSGFNHFLFSPQTLGKISHLIDIFQMG